MTSKFSSSLKSLKSKALLSFVLPSTLVAFTSILSSFKSKPKTSLDVVSDRNGVSSQESR
eukprot:02697.XXX_31381_31560_1 [CDS] Oithona nana genome sequencing.